MSEIENDKPKKRKRKNEERRFRRWLLLMAFLLCLVFPAGLFVYVSVQPEPTPTFVYPTATPVFMLNHHCDVTGHQYQVGVKPSNPYYVESPDKRYVVEFKETGVFLVENIANAEPTLIFPYFINMYYYSAQWSSDSQWFTTRNEAQQFILVDTHGTQRILLDYAEDMFGWSPDNRHVLAHDGDNIWLLPVAGEPRILMPFDPISAYIQNWSPNGEYVVMIRNNAADYTTKHITLLPVDAQRPVVVHDVPVFNQYVEWSPDGKNVVLFTQLADQKQIRFVALDGSASQEYTLPQGMQFAPVPVVWSTDRRKIALYLRPETDPTPQTILILSLDGTVTPVATISTDQFSQLRFAASSELNMTALHWSADDSEFRYWADNTLYRFEIATGETSTLFAPTETTFGIQTLHYLPAVDRLWVRTEQPDKTLIDVLSPNGDNLAHFELPFVETAADLMPFNGSSRGDTVVFTNANSRNPYVVNFRDLWAKPLLTESAADMGLPAWSPHGNFVAITWSDKQAVPQQFFPDRRVFLTLMDANTGSITTLDDAFYSVYDLVWTTDEQHVIYTAWRETGTTIEMLDIQTGEIQQIADGEKVHGVQYDVALQRITLWREAAVEKGVGDWRYEAYRLTGEPIFNFALVNVKLGWSQFFSSDDGMTIIAKTIGAGYESQALQVLDVATHTTHIVAKDLKGLGNPVWSPDGNFIMFTQWTQDNILSVQLIDRTSKPLWSQQLERLYQLDWQKCG